MKKDTNKHIFIEITNQDIYDKLIDVEKHVMTTNGKVKFNTKAVYCLSVVLLAVIGWFVTYLIV